MSDNEPVPEFLELEEKRLMELMQKKAQTRGRSGMGESLIMREADNKKAVANIFEKMREGKIPSAPVTAPDAVIRLDEKTAEPVPAVAPESAPVLTETVARFRGDKKKVVPAPVVEAKKDDFNLEVKFEEKLEEGKHDIPTESLTNPKVKDTVGKLRAMAASLRGESVTQPDKPLVVKLADSPSGQLMENVDEPSFTLKKLNSMLYRAQDRFNQTDNPVYESIADELSSAIAEALLQNRKVVPKSKISGPARNF